MAEEKEIFISDNDEIIVGEDKKPAALDASIEQVSTDLPTAPPSTESVTVKVSMQKATPNEPERVEVTRSVLPEIVEKIHDRNFPLDEVARLIAIEISFVAQEMSALGRKIGNKDITESYLMKSFDQRIKALQALEKSLTSADTLRKRDILNLDGPKFGYVYKEIVAEFKKACADALGKNGETMIQSIMKHWRDRMAIREASLRKEVERLDKVNYGLDEE